MTVRLAVLASGNGSNFQAILDAIDNGRLDATVVVLVTNDESAFALSRAADARTPSVVVTREPGEDRAAYDTRLIAALAPYGPEVVVLAGWMRVLSMKFLSNYPSRVVNLHPALPGEFPGVRAIERALDAARDTGLARTGVMVHLVPDEGVDDGPVLACEEVAIHTDDTLESLASRVHAVEHRLLVSALADFSFASPT